MSKDLAAALLLLAITFQLALLVKAYNGDWQQAFKVTAILVAGAILAGTLAAVLP